MESPAAGAATPAAAAPAEAHAGSKAAPPPSRVVHFRNVGPEITNNDLMQSALSFGPVSHLIVLRSKNQALLQFQELQNAVQFVEYYTANPCIFRGRTAYVQYSSHQELSAAAGGQEQAPSRILLVTIQLPLYPITVDVLNQVFSPFETNPRGTVEKCVIFQKQAGLQALVQFSSSDCAARAKTSLDGKNIYSNCCTLNIQFSNLQDLTVNVNSDKSRDYTRPDLPQAPPTPFPQQMAQQQMYPQQQGMIPGSTYGTDRAVLLVSGLPDKMTCDMLFRLFSNYGNIVRIKLLHSKAGTALVQLGDNFQASTALNYVKGLRLFGSTLDVNYSHFSYISPPSPQTQDGKTQDYSNNPLNRFLKAGSKNFQHISPPSKTLHVSNLPNGMAQEPLVAHLSQHAPVSSARLFDSSNRRQALVQFDSIEHAAETLCLFHDSVLQGQHIRLAFSKNQV